ncbi:Uncharacterised protein [Mycobacterium tuberculosis]|nr:Uncharacterised protein [Mycobacterium tuberculosis]
MRASIVRCRLARLLVASRREPIEQVHILPDQRSKVGAFELPGRNGKHGATKNGRTVQCDLSQPRHIHSFFG